MCTGGRVVRGKVRVAEERRKLRSRPMACQSKLQPGARAPSRRLPGALTIGAAFLLSTVMRRGAATMIGAPAVPHVLKMVGAAAAATQAAPAAAGKGGLVEILRGEGMQKSLSFFAMILVGLGLRSKPAFSDPKIKRGVKELLSAQFIYLWYTLCRGRYSRHCID